MKFHILLLLSAGFLLINQTLFAQTTIAPLTPHEKKQVIDSTCRLIKALYIFPETGSRLAIYIANKANFGGYAGVNDPNALADSLTADLVQFSKDRHFRIFYDPAWVSDSKASVSHADSLALRSKRAEKYRAVNYGFKEISNLDGNIGYLKLTNFADPLVAGPTAVAAMNALSNSDALIIDIRGNSGGFSTSVSLIASYLFDDDQDFSLAYVPGARMPRIPVYLLIDHFTYSAAEGFSQLLKIHKRAILIGETTGGAAHGIERKAISDRFYINMPFSRPTPDWEGTGIEPDIKVEAHNAYNAALVSALQDLSRIHPEKSPEYQWLMEDVQAQQIPVLVNTSVLKNFVGTYGNRQLFIANGKLFFHREGDQKYALAPLGQDLFRFVDTDDIRLKFISDQGEITALKILYKDGSSKIVPKTNEF
jgi:hypothetical protein